MIETGIYSYGKSYLSQNGRPFCTASLYATVCRDCGSVVRTYCKNPEKLFPKKERRE